MKKSSKGKVWLEAAVDYRPLSWSHVSIEGGIVVPDKKAWPLVHTLMIPGLPASLAAKGLDTRMIIVRGIDLTRLPEGNADFLEGHPRFWEELRQLAFAFDDDDEERVRGFYQTYGELGRNPVASNPITSQHDESWAWAKDVVSWFRMLVSLTEAVKEHKVGFLREYGHEHTFTDRLRAAALRGPHFNYFEPSYKQWWRRGTPDYHIFFPYDTIPGGVLRDVYVPPQDDEKLLSGTWKAITFAATEYLNMITLTPVVQDFSDTRSPRVAWGFQVAGAMDAAFLQWFFREFWKVEFDVCAASDCANLVPEGRRKWCSETCREREKKREDRRPKPERGTASGGRSR